MATLVRDIERPSFLDPPTEDQLSLGTVAAPVRDGAPSLEEAPPPRETLSERLRGERSIGVGVSGLATARTVATRGGEATLDALLVGAWEGLSARRPVACPVCAGPMNPRVGAAAGDCGDCGSQLR